MARYYGVPLRNGLPIGLGSAISLRKPGGAAAAVPDPYFEYTTLLLPGNGTNGAQNNTFLDSSTNNFTITRNGNTTQGTFSPFSQTGWGNYFDGTGDYLSLPSNTAFTMGTGDFTFEAWVYINAAKDYNFVFDSRASDSDAAGFGFFVDSSSRLCFYTNYNFRIQAGSVPINTWNHVALVRNGSTFTAYVNGVSVGTYTATPNLTNSTGRIGTDWASLYSMNGYISNFRLVKGTAVYTSSFTPPTAPLTAITNTSLLTCQSNRFIDNSTNNFTITRNGDVSVQAFSPFNPTAAWSAATNGGSGYFDGSGDYLSWTGTALGSGNFTAECWVYFNPYSTANYAIIGSAAANTSAGWELFLEGATSTIKVYSGGVVVLASSTVTANQWYHLAFVRSGSTVTLYINGTSVGTATLTANLSNTTMYVSYDFAGQTMAGYVSGVRHVVGTAVYTTGFTPPTAPPTAITSTSALLNFTNAGIYDATSKNDLETVGNAQISTTQSKFGGSSMYFDGTGDYLKAISTDLLNFGTGDFTIEFWSYFNSTADSGGLGMGVITNPTGTYSTIYSSTNGGTTLTFYNGSGIVSGTIALSTWQHIAVSRYNGTVRFFVNGIQTASATHTSAVTFSAAFIGSQTASGGYFNGYLDDFRVTKGIARYTSNFTPPTTAFLTL